MNLKNYLFSAGFVLCLLFSLQDSSFAYPITYTKYYVSVEGSDNNSGTIVAPFKTIQKVNSLHLPPGTIIYFKGGEVFKGTLVIGRDMCGNKGRHVIFSSYGGSKATINRDSLSAINVYKAQYVDISDINLTGLGRKTGNRENGLVIINSEHINVSNLDISGFQKSGLLIDSSSHVEARGVFAHDNGSAGITVEGRSSKKDSRDIQITNCRAENNPGDPTKLDNHSGNGIVVGHCTNVTISGCTATNNGWDMPRIGNGPVGIWCYEADSVKIEYCLSYRNKTSKGGADGGGFDFDGGTTNSVIQYCYSYENQGSGYCIFQYWGASPFYNNIIRNNISYNDGTVSDSQAGLYIWNSSGDAKQFRDVQVYDNIIYNTKVAAISFSEKSFNQGFSYTHNIFVGRDTLIKGRDSLANGKFIGNDWWSLKHGFNMYGEKKFKKWALENGHELRYGKVAGFNVAPKFVNPDITSYTDASSIMRFKGYKFSGASALKKPFGGDLKQVKMADIVF